VAEAAFQAIGTRSIEPDRPEPLAVAVARQERVKQRVLVVIPAHNEENTIASVLEHLRRVAPEFDRVVVNDGSKDATGDIVASLGERQLRLPCNLGYGHALQTGLKYSLLRGYDIVVSIDADGQHNPGDVPRLVAMLGESKADMVIGSRFSDGRSYQTPFGRRVGQLFFSHVTRILVGHRIYDTTSGFKVLRAAACEEIVDGAFLDFHIETLVRLSMSGFKIVEVPVSAGERTRGRSMHSFTSVFRYPLQTVLLTVVAVVDSLLGRRAR
jgi:glycosyltransferase involved in cell wall biosynthesis